MIKEAETMNIKNFEFKAKVDEIKKYEIKLRTLNPEYKGINRQIDTYFDSRIGRLKLREGNNENSLIDYERENIAGSKQSAIILYQHKPSPALKEILSKQLGIKTIVAKKRKIYFIDNVKFHFDVVEKLGTFIEVEAFDDNNEFNLEELKAQCDKYFDFFQLTKKDLIDKSYSDLIIGLTKSSS